MTAPIIPALGEAAAVSIADHSAATSTPGFEATFAVRAVVDGHPTLGMNGTDAAAAIKLGGRAALRRDTDLFPAGVEDMGVAVGGGFGSAAFGNCGCFGRSVRRAWFAARRSPGLCA
jgi:hypothetical protein